MRNTIDLLAAMTSAGRTMQLRPGREASAKEPMCQPTEACKFTFALLPAQFRDTAFRIEIMCLLCRTRLEDKLVQQVRERPAIPIQKLDLIG